MQHDHPMKQALVYENSCCNKLVSLQGAIRLFFIQFGIFPLRDFIKGRKNCEEGISLSALKGDAFIHRIQGELAFCLRLWKISSAGSNKDQKPQHLLSKCFTLAFPPNKLYYYYRLKETNFKLGEKLIYSIFCTHSIIIMLGFPFPPHFVLLFPLQIALLFLI